MVVVESGYTSFDAMIQALNEIEDPGGHYTRALDGRYRGLGGSSSRWGGRLIPISEHERGERDYISQPAWPDSMSSFDRYNALLETLLRVDKSPFEHGGHPRTVGGTEFFSSGDEDITVRWAKCAPFKFCNMKAALGDQLKHLKSLEIWLGATVCGFEHDRDNGRLASITARSFNGNTMKVRADQFVVAAGAIETTRLLLLLDEASENRAFQGCNALGTYFQDHLKAKVATIDRSDPAFTNRVFAYRFVNATRRDLHMELSPAAQRQDSVGSAFAYVAMDFTGSRLSHLRQMMRDVQRGNLVLRDALRVSTSLPLLARSLYWRYTRKQLFAPADIKFDVMICAEQLPAASNRIRLSDERDKFGMRKARFEWGPTEADERTFRSAIAHLGAFWHKSGLARLSPLNWHPAAVDPGMPIIAQAEACAHPSGSTRMGTDPAESVVGPDLHCHAVPNVAVASASVFPTAGSANPTFTIMGLALWLADTYLENSSYLPLIP